MRRTFITFIIILLLVAFCNVLESYATDKEFYYQGIPTTANQTIIRDTSSIRLTIGTIIEVCFAITCVFSVLKIIIHKIVSKKKEEHNEKVIIEIGSCISTVIFIIFVRFFKRIAVIDLVPFFILIVIAYFLLHIAIAIVISVLKGKKKEEMIISSSKEAFINLAIMLIVCGVLFCTAWGMN